MTVTIIRRASVHPFRNKNSLYKAQVQQYTSQPSPAIFNSQQISPNSLPSFKFQLLSFMSPPPPFHANDAPPLLSPPSPALYRFLRRSLWQRDHRTLLFQMLVHIRLRSFPEPILPLHRRRPPRCLRPSGVPPYLPWRFR